VLDLSLKQELEAKQKMKQKSSSTESSDYIDYQFHSYTSVIVGDKVPVEIQ
jgi:hypothetical protein